jgi:putative transposase
VIHVDNAKEFHSQALLRGCQEYGITLEHRPRRQPHFGGHIERVIGTMMGAVHLLPGATFSNSQEKGDYDSEGRSVLTLPEL